MKIVCISDTHGKHRSMNPLPDGDILIHAGDFSNDGSPEGVKEIIDFNNWLGEQKQFKWKIVIAGNHDIYFQTNPRAARALLDNAIYLQDSAVILEGLKIYGSPWTPRFFDWAFMGEPETLRAIWAEIPEDVDILITHGPARGVCDRMKTDWDSLGCRELSLRIGRLTGDLKLHVHGHIHGGYGRSARTVNAAICNEALRPINLPIVVDL